MDDYRRRNSLRYPGHDYASAGNVFITICTHERQRLFGMVTKGEMHPSPAGVRVAERWSQIHHRFPGIAVDAFVAMPDHLHGILIVGANPAIPLKTRVGEVVRWLKTALLADYRTGVRDHGWPRYNGLLWQRDYHDHLIRNDHDLANHRAYIAANPANWRDDHEHWPA